MKQLITFLAAALFCSASMAQVDSTRRDSSAVDIKRPKSDTIRIGNIIIIKKEKDKNAEDVWIEKNKSRQKKQNANISTNWGIVDLGFANYIDNTDYSNTGNYLVNRPNFPDLGKSDFKLRTGKSVNVNIWFFMQRLNLVKHYVNLKYGLGLELNNYRYKSAVSYKEGGTIPYTANNQATSPFIFRDSIEFKKNKLAADYLTVPFMINFNSDPQHNKGLTMSVGVSAGYLYSQRNKQVSEARGKEKNKGDYDLERFKLSYIAELGLGPVRLYGSYSPQSMYQNGLNIKPYTVGIRFSNW